MKLSRQSQQYPSLSITYIFIFLVGLACMVVAGYFLIEGLSQFSGSPAAKRMLIVGGILFQLTESICFISASALTYHSLRWRYTLFTLGIVLFSFSIAVMTLAQKTALQTGEAQANAIDEKRQQLRNQLQSLEQIIDSYRLNAEKQSKSIYKDSRAMGQDSINRATELEEKKYQLSEQLFQLNSQRRQTSADFFHRLEEVTGLPEKTTEFYFLVIRSLLLELCGIILMSFGANLRAYNKLVVDAQGMGINKKTDITSNGKQHNIAQTSTSTGIDKSQTLIHKAAPSSSSAKTVVTDPNSKILSTVAPQRITGRSKPLVKPEQKFKEKRPAETEPEAVNLLASPSLRQEHIKQQTGASAHQLDMLSVMAMDLFEQNLIDDLSASSILNGLTQHCRQSVNEDQAGMLSKILISRTEETC